MKKSLKKILFAILTVFAVFFVVACGNKEDAKINKEEVLQKNVEAYKNIKSADMLIKLKMEPKKSGQPMELTMDVSITLEPIATITFIVQSAGPVIAVLPIVANESGADLPFATGLVMISTILFVFVIPLIMELLTMLGIVA